MKSSKPKKRNIAKPLPDLDFFYRAEVEVIQGNRKVCNLLANAGLGITGAGIKEVLQIDYKPGESVDTQKVENTMNSLISETDKLQTEFKILSYKVLQISLLHPSEKPKICK